MGQKGDQTASLPPFAAFFNAAGSQQAGTPPAPAGAQAGGAGAPAGADAMMPAAVAWWNLLQDQFRQAVASAMPAEGGQAAKQAGDKGTKAEAAVPDPAARAGAGNGAGGDTGGTPGTSSQKPSRAKSDKA
jgi:hypothetical protein